MRLARVLLLTLLTLPILGCRGLMPKPSNLTPALARVESHRLQAASHLSEVRPHVAPPGIKPLEAADDALARQGEAIVALDKGIRAEQAKADRMAERWYVRWGQRIERVWWWLVGLLITAAVVRLVAVFLPGPLGAIAAFASTGVLGVLSGGISLVTSLADNLFFRRRKTT